VEIAVAGLARRAQLTRVGARQSRAWPDGGELTLVDYVDPVLVVDDLNTMTRIVDGMLRKCGFANIDQVHDGPTALQKLREKSYLFVVSDREMPGMNGLELAREIRADPKIRNVPLVIMSASSEPKHAEDAIAAGANFFMTKPFNLTTLKDVITQLTRPAQN
jgi:two-component system chemotaxis response regulator CheY